MRFFSLLVLCIVLFSLSFISCQSYPSIICPEGSFYSSSANRCQLCPVGEYQDYVGRTECMKCPRDMYSALEGASQCTRCDTGFYAPDRGSLTCIPCQAGYYIDPAMAFQRLSLCLPCSAGQWSEAASSSCNNCKAGYFNIKDGSTSCSPCPPNTFAQYDGSTTCIPCNAGLFAAEGATTCTADIATNSNTNEQVGQSSMTESGSLSRNKIIAIVGGSIGGLLLVSFIGLMVYRQYQKKINIEKNRLMIEQNKRSSLNRSSFSQSVNNNNVEAEDGIAVAVGV